MPKFILTYHGGETPSTPEEGKEGMAKWKAWADSLGDALIDPGTPVGITKVITHKGVSSERSPHPLMGFSILQADDMEQAIKLVEDCPHLHMFKGTLEVSEMQSMPM